MSRALKTDSVKLGELAAAVEARAGNLFASGEMFCSQAALWTLNQALGGGLSRSLCLKLGSVHTEGGGGAGCQCGALAGASLALGLFLGPDKSSFGGSRAAMEAAAELHARFKERFGSACCRVLTKKVRHDPKLHLEHCMVQTGAAAKMAAEIILARRPELAEDADIGELKKRSTKLGARARMAANLIF